MFDCRYVRNQHVSGILQVREGKRTLKPSKPLWSKQRTSLLRDCGFMAMRTQHRTCLAVIVLVVFGCIASQNFALGCKGNMSNKDGEESELHRANQEIRELKKALAKTLGEARDVKQKLDEAREALDKKCEALDKTLKEASDLQRRNHALNSTLQALTEQLLSDDDLEATMEEVYDEVVTAPGTNAASFTGDKSEKSYMNGVFRAAARHWKKSHEDLLKKNPGMKVNWTMHNHHTTKDSSGTKTSSFNASGKSEGQG